jgi:hypothetical protein
MDKRQIEKGCAGLHKNRNRLLRGIEMHPHPQENGSVNEIEVPQFITGKLKQTSLPKEEGNDGGRPGPHTPMPHIY